MSQTRLEEFKGYGYVTLGEAIDGETLVAKMFDTGVVVVMAVHGQYLSQVRFTKEQFEALTNIGTTEDAQAKPEAVGLGLGGEQNNEL